MKKKSKMKMIHNKILWFKMYKIHLFLHKLITIMKKKNKNLKLINKFKKNPFKKV